MKTAEAPVALGMDFDGTIDEAPEFFEFLASSWPGPRYLVTYREDKAKVVADAAKLGIQNVEVVLVNSFAEKADANYCYEIRKWLYSKATGKPI